MQTSGGKAIHSKFTWQRSLCHICILCGGGGGPLMTNAPPCGGDQKKVGLAALPAHMLLALHSLQIKTFSGDLT